MGLDDQGKRGPQCLLVFRDYQCGWSRCNLAIRHGRSKRVGPGGAHYLFRVRLVVGLRL